VIQQGTWFGVLGACHDATGTTMHNSYAHLGHDQTTILGAPDRRESRLYHTGSSIAPPGTGSISFATAGQIARVELDIPATCRARSRPSPPRATRPTSAPTRSST
jgi:hypothetical protein